jgi:hypothetical protein
MRRIFLVLLLTAMTVSGYSQNPIKETREIFDNFGSKTTKVVVPSTSLADLMLRDAVERGWRISPFEFCTMEEYEKIRHNPDYFFLLRVEGKFRKELEPKIEYLTLIKGGPEVKRGLYSSKDMITLPLQRVDSDKTTHLHLLPVYIDVIQNHIYEVQSDLTLAFKGNTIYSDRVDELKDKELLFPMEYLNYSVSENRFLSQFLNNIKIVDESDVERAFEESRENTVVPLLITPGDESRGSYCYKILVGTDDHRLYFFRRHKISRWISSGFTREDIRKISTPFQF